LQRDRGEDLRVTAIVETKGEPLKKLIIVQHRRSMSENAFGSKEELSSHQRRIKYQIEPVNAGWPIQVFYAVMLICFHITFEFGRLSYVI
jgi:hypothetical protein